MIRWPILSLRAHVPRQVRCLLGFALKGLAGAAPDKDTSDTSSEHRSGVYLLTAQLATKLTFTKKVRARADL